MGNLMSFDVTEAKADPVHAARSMELEGSCVLFGSSQSIDGQVYDGHKTVLDQHACLYFAKGKWWIKSVNGITHCESMTLHPYLRDSEGRPPKRWTSTGNRKIETIMPMDGKRRLSREICVFRLGDSDRRFWVSGPLPLKDGEVEEDGGDRKKDKESRRDKDDRDRGEKDRGRRDRDEDRKGSPKRDRGEKERERRGEDRSRSRR